MPWFKSNLWKVGITIAGMLLLLVLIIWVVAALGFVAWWFPGVSDNIAKHKDAVPILQAVLTGTGSILGAVIAVVGVITTVWVGFWQWRTNRNDTLIKESKDRQKAQDNELRDREDARQKEVEAQDKELRDRAEERFKTAVAALGDKNEATQVGGAILLRSFLNPDDKKNYGRYYTEIFDLAVAYLRISRTSPPSEDPDGILHSPVDPNTPLPLTSLRRALIVVFKEAFPLARNQNKGGPQSLDATYIQLDNAYFAGADLEHAWMPQSRLGGADLRGAILWGADLREANLHEADLRGANLWGADLRGANLHEADLRGANLGKAKFTKADLGDVKLREASLYGADLRGANLRGATLSKTNLSEVNLSEANLSGAQLREIDLSKAILPGVKFSGATFSEAILSGVNLRGVDLSGADLKGVHLNAADLRSAQLNGADLRGTHLEDVSLSGADLTNANLSGAHLSRSVLKGITLRGARLNSTQLNEADLTGTRRAEEACFIGADLSNAILKRANLNGANFKKANLTRADFSKAFLNGVDMRQAQSLTGTNLRGVRGLMIDQLKACKDKGAIIDEDTTTSPSQSPVPPPAPPQS